MPKSIFRKLRDYIKTENKYGITTTTSIFGTLTDNDCVFSYDNTKYQFNGCVDSKEYEFLLDYYVVGIFSNYEIKDNKIKPYLLVCLRKDIKDICI